MAAGMPGFIHCKPGYRLIRIRVSATMNPHGDQHERDRDQDDLYTQRASGIASFKRIMSSLPAGSWSEK